MSSEAESVIDKVIAVDWVPSTAVSSTPVTVTVWAADQFAEVNVRFAGLTVNSPVSALATEITTFEVGALLRTTVNVSVLPMVVAVVTVVASVTSIEPVVSTTVNPALSSSLTVTGTLKSGDGSKQASEEASTIASVTFGLWLASAVASSTPVTVTVWVVDQFAEVNVN